MRVLHLNAGNLYGGIETYLVTLARLRHLCPEMEPSFGLCFPGRLRDELLATGVQVQDFGPVRLSRPWTVFRARRRLKNFLHGARVEVVVTHGCWPHAVFAPTVRRAGCRLVNAVHGDHSHPSWLDRWAARTPPDVVIANSRFTAGPAAKLFPRSRVEVVYLPVPAPDLGDREKVRREVREALGTPTDTVVILIVSRLEELKGHAILLDALDRLEDVPGWECWVVGGAQRPNESGLLDRLHTQLRTTAIADRVRWLGPRPDVPALMASANIYCQPNTGPEGFGLTFVEALYAGLPVVTSAFGGAVEIVDESCGVLTAPGDATAVADALKSLITDAARRKALGTTGPRRANEVCNPVRVLDRLCRANASRE